MKDFVKDTMTNMVAAVTREKRIAAVTVRDGKHMYATALVKHSGKIIISEYKALPRNGEELQAMLIPFLNRARRTFDIVINETTGKYSRACGGIMLPIDEPIVLNGEERGPIIIDALNQYQELNGQEMITVPNASFNVPKHIVNIRQATRGERTFDIDYSELTPERILTLLIVFSAGKHLNAFSYLQEMMSPQNSGWGNPPGAGLAGSNMGEYSRGLNAITDTDRRAAEAAPKSLTGTTLPDGSRIL